MSKLTNQWIELFRSGKADGKPEITNADIDQIIQNYDPRHHEAPATIGHIEDAGPAWGWFDGLKRSGDLLLGKMRQVQPAFEEMVSSGLFKKRSVGLVKDDRGWNLHHVAFLGAKPPAIKGLADCVFGSEMSSLTKVEFEEDSMAGEEKTLMDRMNAWFDEKFPKTTINTATFGEADVKRVAAEAVAAAIAPVQTAYDALKVQFAERDKKLATAETQGRADAAIAALKTSGRWVPAFDKIGLPVVFAALASDVTVVEFGEGASKKSVPVLDAFVAFMDQLPKIVPTAAVYTGQASAAKPAKGVNAGPQGVDAGSLRLHDAIADYAEKNKCSYTEATFKVVELHPELSAPGGSSTGSV